MVRRRFPPFYLLGVKEFEKDQGVMVDVHKDPELFGFTYKAYLAMTFNPDEEGSRIFR